MELKIKSFVPRTKELSSPNSNCLTKSDQSLLKSPVASGSQFNVASNIAYSCGFQTRFFRQPGIPRRFLSGCRGQREMRGDGSGAQGSGPPILTPNRAALCQIESSSQHLKMTCKLRHQNHVKANQLGRQDIMNLLVEVHIPPMK